MLEDFGIEIGTSFGPLPRQSVAHWHHGLQRAQGLRDDHPERAGVGAELPEIQHHAGVRAMQAAWDHYRRETPQ